MERWRPHVRAELKRQGVYSKWIENKAMRIISRESSGNPKAGRVRGCYGLFQFDRGWIRRSRTDWRGSGYQSIRVFVRAYRQGGVRNIRKHWAATY